MKTKLLVYILFLMSLVMIIKIVLDGDYFLAVGLLIAIASEYELLKEILEKFTEEDE